MIIETLNVYGFRDAFKRCGRADQFSYDGLEVLFDHLESLSDDLGEDIQLDVIALCCEYSEEHWWSIAEQFDIDLSEYEEDDDKIEAVRDYLESKTIVAGETINSFVYEIF
jgi:hypothetical protein